MMKRFALICVLAAAVAACTRKNPEFCTSTADCMDPAKPFCDVNGSFGDLMNDCIAAPMDAGAEPDAEALDAPPGGCSPGAALACIDGNLTTCSADGHTTTQAACPLGCATTESRCLTFAPSNGLGSALADAADQPDVVLPQGAKIDTDLGLVETSAGATITVKSVNVTQTGGPAIRVFEASSFVLDDLTIQGTEAVAFVAPGRISVIGKVTARGVGAVAGPGAVTTGAPCVGATKQSNPSSLTSFFEGAGGAGNATVGGAGGNSSSSAGAAVHTSAPLSGGCDGGNQIDLSSNVVKRGGGGGGAMQLVSLESVDVSTHGFVDLGGGGGDTYSGGGAGGLLVVEAPVVRVDGAATGITANGGAGGACNIAGADGDASANPAAAPVCGDHTGGDGGAGAAPAKDALTCHAPPGQHCGVSQNYGGGGGAAGRLRVATRDGTIEKSDAPTLSVQITADTLVTQ